MYQVGEYVVHPGQGVCRVEDVTSGPTATYQLMPIGERHPMRISFPVASENRLRPVLSADEARAIIDEYPTMEIEECPERSANLEEEHFKREIRNGSCQDLVRIVKTFRVRIAEVKARNKKPPVVYDRILKQASARSLQELAVALDSTPEDVKALFEDRLAQEQVENN
ncbi:MAG: CarD family transcriptional regulator [Tractidigestivibacter sp.]|jgi:RNA polymerase-interacting CarD/CdnL/TRCF family regulator|uniref:CarD family transcriptional regulator n=1 Tax=Tractidigestivibacter sp. TaxID=2847320 RepID=UPI003D8BBA45